MYDRLGAKGVKPLGVACAELAQWGRPWCSYRTLLGCGERKAAPHKKLSLSLSALLYAAPPFALLPTAPPLVLLLDPPPALWVLSMSHHLRCFTTGTALEGNNPELEERRMRKSSAVLEVRFNKGSLWA